MKKSLQKVTEFENINSVEEGKEFLRDNREHLKEFRKNVIDRLNESLKSMDGNEFLLTELAVECLALQGDDENATTLRNITYENNYAAIARYIHNHTLEFRGFPTVAIISEKTGLSRPTVYRHLRNDFKGKFDTFIKGKHQLMANKALEHLYYLGVKEDNATALKTFIEFTGNANKGNTTNNFIQINNLKLTREEFEQLPDEAIGQIEKIISKNMIGRRSGN